MSDNNNKVHRTIQGVWSYLESIEGLLEYGTDEEIEAAKKEYRKIYKRENKRKQREKRPEVIVVFPDRETYKEVETLAKATKRNVSAFLLESSLAYTKQKLVNPQKAIYQNIEQAICKTEIHIRNIWEDMDENGSIEQHNYNLLLQEILNLQHQVEEKLDTPHLLKQTIQDYINQKPWEKDVLLRFIQKL